ncbi:MAG: UDP-N-acetylmuramoyl-L-alanine--D-glutamate ligase, partial [Shewanella sp.]
MVLGLGATGLSVVRYLCGKGITPLVMDSRRQPPGAETLAAQFPEVELISGGFDCRYLVQASQIIISPGIALNTPEVRAALDMGIEVIGDIELFAREIADRKPCVIGITGSNGKTTVTTLVGELLTEAGIAVAVGGNIGVPALDLLAQDPAIFVLELSSFQLETTHSLNCVIATCLNVTEDHMDRYSDMDAYRAAKLRLYHQSRAVIFNRDDALTLPTEPMNQNSFGLAPPELDEWGIVDGKICHGQSEIMPITDVALIGSHNHANLLAAMALVDVVGVDKYAMAN